MPYIPGYLSQLVPVMSRWMEKMSEISPMAGDSTEELRESMVRRRVLVVTDTHDTVCMGVADVLDLSSCCLFEGRRSCWM